MNTTQILQGIKDWITNLFARKDGFYETMGVGTAVNLAGQTERTNDKKFRTSGGTEDIATGTARLESIKGNAIAWNQLAKTDERTDWNYYYGTGSITNHVITYTVTTPSSNARIARAISPIEGHIYYCACKKIQGYSPRVRFRVGGALKGYKAFDENGRASDILASGTDDNLIRIDMSSVEAIVGDIAVLSEISCIDLTLVYGEGNEPSTPEEFEADYQRWFGKALTYEDYDACSLKNVQYIDYKTVGFNLLNPTTGKAHLIGTYGATNVEQGLYCYEISGNYTSITDEEGNTITPNANGYFMVDTPQEITVVGADEETCIHLTWSGWRNGETELHWNEVKQMPITTLTGKLNGEGSSVVVFPDGMKSVGNVYDEIKVENGVVKAIKRIGSRAYQEGDVTSDTMLTDGSTTTYYILETPQEYILDDFELPIRFKVDDFGTEEQVGEGINAILTCKYGVNAVDVLRRMNSNYISVESMDNFLTKLGVAMNGVWSKSWNENTQEYDFTFLANGDEPEPESVTNNQEEA